MAKKLESIMYRIWTPNIQPMYVCVSGHGGSVRDALGGDETDNRDETMIPADFIMSGQIRDDELLAEVHTYVGGSFQKLLYAQNAVINFSLNTYMCSLFVM